MLHAKSLKVYGASKDLAVETYRVTASFPREELYGLVSQMRRSSVSVGSNIAEGAGRGSDGELRHALQNALASASELEFQIDLSQALGFIPAKRFTELQRRVEETKKMLARFIIAVRARERQSKGA